ncbi:MAG: CotH kinase family protein [Bacteroidetes bacterium]|nr:CotH kinase family protein [Bacteroidota bacterium]
MKTALLLLPLFLCGAALRAQDIDSTALLFDDSYVHEFNITFYYPDWEDSLKYWYENGEEYIPARIEYEGLVFDSVGVRYKGNSSYNMSRNTPKKPLKFAFDKYRSKQECYDVETLNFSNATKDPTFLREKICYDMIATRMHAPRTAFAAIKVDGNLLGLFTMVEQVDKKFLKRHFTDNGFNLYKAADNGASLEYRGDAADSYRAEYELKTNEKADDWTRFITMINRLSSVPDAQFRDQLGAWIEFESAIQLLAFNMVMSNFDSYTGSGRNFYVYDDESTGQFTFIPWDINEGFGSYSNNWNVFTQDVLNISNLNRRPLNRRILGDDLLRARYLRAIASLVAGPAHEDSIAAQIARWKPLIDPWVQADQNKLYSYQQFLDNMDRDVMVGPNMPVPGLTRFSQLRNQNLRTQLLNYASMSTDAVPESALLTAWNYPNPVTAQTSVAFVVPTNGEVTFVLFDALGRELRRSAIGAQAPGTYETQIAGQDLDAGVHFYQLILTTASGVVQRAAGKFTVLR